MSGPSPTSTRKRVALVVPSFEEGGGVPTSALFIANVMRATGRYEPEFISVATSHRDPLSVRLLSPASWLRGVRTETVEWQGERATRVGAFLSELEFQRYRPRKALTSLLEGFDIVHVVAGVPSWGWLARDVKVPVGLFVATLIAMEREQLSHGSLPRRLLRSLMTRIATRIEALGLAIADQTFVINPGMYNLLAPRIGESNVSYAPTGVDTDALCPPEDGERDDAYLLCVGRLADRRKRVDLLIAAYAHLCSRMPNAPRLQLAGSTGPSDADWALASKLGVRERIDYAANLSYDELIETYRGAALFCLTSDEEGLGIVVIEGMACGVPSICTDCGGPRASVVHGETGRIVPAGDATAFGDALFDLLGDDELRGRMRIAARQRAVDVFSREAAGRVFTQWYDRALGDD